MQNKTLRIANHDFFKRKLAVFVVSSEYIVSEIVTGIISELTV